jgi:antitoxin component YwqK of YwqJK toxin-antitoxin module
MSMAAARAHSVGMLLAIGLCAGCIGACASAPPPKPVAAEVTPVEESVDSSTEGLVVLKFDVNGDNRPDIRKYVREKTDASGHVEDVVVRKEIDLNNDGKIDVWRYYDEKGELVKERLDLDFDGLIDCTIYYKSGVVEHKEYDTNFDGKPDLWKYYNEKGQLARVEADRNHDGKVDYWEYWENGKLDRIGYDTNGDGKPETIERAKAGAGDEQAP